MRRSGKIKKLVGSAGAIWIALAIIALAAMPADGQILGGRASGGRLGARLAERLRQPNGETIAVAGTPFGVGRLTVQLPPDTAAPNGGSLLDGPPLTLTEANGRVFYSAAVDTPVRSAIRELLARPRPVTVYFLFTGEEPLDLTLFGPAGVAQRMQVQPDPQLRQQLLAEWWKQYTTAIRRPNRSDDYPHLADAYLTSMLANRLSLPRVEWPRGWLAEKLPDPNQSLGLVLGTESGRLAVELDSMRPPDETLATEPLEPLPEPVSIEAAPMAELIGDVQIEPLAMHVPEECLYVRFAGFPNYQWFRSTLDERGGDLRNLISLRGVDYGLNARLERQLSLKESALSQLLGPTVIADMAIIGDDPFLREGAAIGMLFQARANLLLANDIRNNRAQTLAANPDARETHLAIAGHDVSFLSTPDNRVRSFYAVDGDFHLVTTSRRIVERFYEAGAGERPLGKANDFRHARADRKPSESDSVFAYLSEAFFRQLASPHYQLEMMRRLRSVTDIELVEMARLAAKNERKPAATIQQLISGGYLSRRIVSLAHRPDGSQLIFHGDGIVTDSVRGAHGTFLPIPDTEVRQATSAEVVAYRRFADLVANGATGPIGPTEVAVQRAPLPEAGRERVTLDIRMMPLEKNADKFVRPALGPASRQRIAPLPADIVALEISTSGNGLLKSLFPGGGSGSPTHLFAGILDAEAPAGAAIPGIAIRGAAVPGAAATGAAVQTPAIAGIPLQGILGQGSPAGGLLGQVLPGLNAIEALRWYVGGWPSPGPLANFGIGGSNVQIDAAGYGYGGNFWQRQIATAAGPITVASMKRDVLAEVAGSLNVAEVEQPAQIWLHSDDVSGSKIAGLANQILYLRARGVSRGNARFLHRLTTQLGVDSNDALNTAERLLDARLVSPIGGRYELQTHAGEFPTWTTVGQSEAGGGVLPSAPPDFQSPPLDWFRGVDLYGGSNATGLWAHAALAMQRPGTAAVSNRAIPAQPSPAAPPAESVVAPRAKPKAEIVPPPPIPSPPEPGPK